LEALGFCGRGEGGPFVEAGHIDLWRIDSRQSSWRTALGGTSRATGWNAASDRGHLPVAARGGGAAGRRCAHSAVA
jgi:hypothetical protein